MRVRGHTIVTIPQARQPTIVMNVDKWQSEFPLPRRSGVYLSLARLLLLVLAFDLDVRRLPRTAVMLIFSVFKTLTDQQVTVELKNDLSITGVLKSVDQFLNIRLDNIKVLDEARHPHMMAVKNCFIRGSVVRYVQLPPESVDTQLLEDATRRESAVQAKR